jgi:hypothetical protein
MHTRPEGHSVLDAQCSGVVVDVLHPAETNASEARTGTASQAQGRVMSTSDDDDNKS